MIKTENTNDTLAVRVEKNWLKRVKTWEVAHGKFVEGAQTNPVQAMEWQGRDVMLAQFHLRMATEMDSFRTAAEGAGRPDKLRDMLKYHLERMEDRVLEQKMFRSSSTCPFTNMSRECEAEVTCDVIVFLRDALRETE